MATTMREGRWRGPLVDRVAELLEPRGTVVDVGAGTGTLPIAIAARRPDARVIAVDGDPEVIGRAKDKGGSDQVDWRQGLANETGLGSDSAGVVLMSLLLHHLERDAKIAALAEALRLLAPEGHLVVADWGKPSSLLPRAGFLALRTLDGFSNTADHARGRLAQVLIDAGFEAPVNTLRLATVWGTLELLETRSAG
jgi:ubiquinone/menaquinone biosynthesis C-methylase UbiE